VERLPDCLTNEVITATIRNVRLTFISWFVHRTSKKRIRRWLWRLGHRRDDGHEASTIPASIVLKFESSSNTFDNCEHCRAGSLGLENDQQHCQRGEQQACPDLQPGWAAPPFHRQNGERDQEYRFSHEAMVSVSWTDRHGRRSPRSNVFICPALHPNFGGVAPINYFQILNY